MERHRPPQNQHRSRTATVGLRSGATLLCVVTAINLLCCARSASAQAGPLPAPLIQSDPDDALAGGAGVPPPAPQRLQRPQPIGSGAASNAQIPYNPNAGYQQPLPQPQQPYTGLEQWSGTQLGQSNLMQQQYGGDPGMQPGMRQRKHRHRQQGAFGLVNNIINPGGRPSQQPQLEETDPSIRPPDPYIDHPRVDADGVRHFANGQHFDLSRMSIDQAIGAMRASDPTYLRMMRMYNPNLGGMPGGNILFPTNFGAAR